jgi:hypothetical protein
MRIIAYALLPLIVADAQIHAQSASKNMAIETSIENASKHDLDWVRVAWDGPNFSAGILRVGTFSTDVHLRWPFVPKARLTFVDDKSRERHSIDLSLKAMNEEIQAGRCRAVTIRILDHDKAEVVSGYPRMSGRKSGPK